MDGYRVHGSYYDDEIKSLPGQGIGPFYFLNGCPSQINKRGINKNGISIRVSRKREMLVCKGQSIVCKIQTSYLNRPKRATRPIGRRSLIPESQGRKLGLLPEKI